MGTSVQVSSVASQFSTDVHNLVDFRALTSVRSSTRISTSVDHVPVAG